MEIEGLSDSSRDAFAQIAAGLGMSADALLTKMIEHVVKVDQDMKRLGLRTGSSIEFDAADHSGIAADAISGDVREAGYVWPSEKPFPWSDAHCAAAVRGYAVRWPLPFNEFDFLRGKWEFVDGYAQLHQP